MSKATYIGVDGTARKVKKMYVGVDNVARKVKRAYIGVNGVARLFFSGGELSYYGTATDLSTGRTRLAAATIGEYALFAGGGADTKYASGGSSKTVDAYNKSLVRSTPTALSANMQWHAAATIGDTYALFGGGGYSSYSAVVNAYNPSLTRTVATSLSVARTRLDAVELDNYVLFVGGNIDGSGTAAYSKTVDAYNSSLTRSTPTTLTTGGKGTVAAALNGCAIVRSPWNSTVDIYDSSLTKQTVTSSLQKTGVSATTVGDYALFGGGTMFSTVYGTVTYCNSAFTFASAAGLRVARQSLAATSVGDYALFAGGRTDQYDLTNEPSVSYDSTSNVVDVYDKSLTLTVGPNLNVGAYDFAATSVGDYALFAGGFNNNTYVSRATVDVYQIS